MSTEQEQAMGKSIAGLLVPLVIITFVAGIIIAICGMFMSTNPVCPAGHEGYVVENPRMWGQGGFQGELHGASNFGFSVWRNKVEIVDFRPKTYTEEFNILAKDELNIAFRFQTIIHIKSKSIKPVVEDFAGTKFYERYIKEPLRAMIRKNVETLDSREVKENRELIGKKVMIGLKEYLSTTPFVVTSAVVGNIDYPDVVTKAVEKKLAAKQLLDEKETQRLIAVKDAEIRVEEARGIAESQKIINETLTDQYLQHEAINAQMKMAQSPNHTTVYIPSGTNGIPLIKTVRGK